MTIDADWSDDFFTGVWLDYQKVAWNEGETEQDTDLVEELLDLDPGSRILDVPCGEGRIARSLARRGYEVTGVDRSAELLAIARAFDSAATFDRRDMTDLPFPARFEGAVCWWGSIGYRTEGEDDRFFSAVASALQPGGVFVLDTHVMETVLPNYEERIWGVYDGIYVMEERFFDHEAGRLDTDWTFIKDGRPAEKKSSMRLYSYRELVGKLNAAGFTIEHATGGHDLAPFEVGDSRLVVRAVREG